MDQQPPMWSICGGMDGVASSNSRRSFQRCCSRPSFSRPQLTAHDQERGRQPIGSTDRYQCLQQESFLPVAALFKDFQLSSPIYRLTIEPVIVLVRSAATRSAALDDIDL